MTYSEYIRSLQQRAQHEGFSWERRDADGRAVYIGKMSQFKPLLLFTKLYFTLTACDAERITVKDALDFSAQAMQRAKDEHEGLPIGLQAGIVSIAVLVSESVDDDVRDALSKRPQAHFAAFEMPAVYDLAREELYYYSRIPLWGGMMQPTVRKKTRQLLMHTRA